MEKAEGKIMAEKKKNSGFSAPVVGGKAMSKDSKIVQKGNGVIKVVPPKKKSK